MRHVISLGAGVQSSTMALMAAHGEIKPLPECAIFADTGWEPDAVYQWLNFLCGAPVEGNRQGTFQSGVLPFPVQVVGDGRLREEQLTARMRGKKEQGERWASLPYFTKSDGSVSEGRIKRQCTSEYKIQPIETFIKRNLLGLKYRQRAPREPVVCQWRGISTDEASRMKPSRLRWMEVRYPLAMECRMARSDCLAWMGRHGYPVPPRSACKGCPFHSDAEWRDMKLHRPADWLDVVEFDKSIRHAGGMRAETFLHRSCVPLESVDLSAPEDCGQTDIFKK